jgi:hypothetical protein
MCAAAAVTATAASATFLPLAGAASTKSTGHKGGSVTVQGFSGIASSRALVLTLFGQTITGGFSSAGINDGVAAASEAEGLLTPGLVSASRANALQGQHTGSNVQHCATPSVPGQLAALISISISCSQSQSSSTKVGTASATSSSSVLTLSVNLLGLLLHNQSPGLGSLGSIGNLGGGLGNLGSLGNLGKGLGLGSLGSLGKNLGSLGTGKLPIKLPKLPALPIALPGQSALGGLGSGSGVGSGNPLSPLLSALQSVFGPLPKIPVDGLSLSTLINEITHSHATQVLRVVLGGSQSAIYTDHGTGVAKSGGGAAEVDLLPGAGLDGAPLLKIAVGEAHVTSVIGAGGHSFAVDNPSLVSITISSPLGSKVINIAPGQSQTLLAGTPLATTIAAGFGTTATDPNGTEHSTADAVTTCFRACRVVSASR